MKKNIGTYSYCLPPNLQKRWLRFAKDCGLNRSEALTKFMSSFLDAFEEAEIVPDAKRYREAQKKNCSMIHASETGLKIAISLEESFVVAEEE